MLKNHPKYSFLTAKDAELLDAVCSYINENINKSIGWTQLTQLTGLSHKDLMDLFKQVDTTPMTYIRNAKYKTKKDIDEINRIESYKKLGVIKE